MNRWLFVDMNSFFASVEQQENPKLRGRPIIISPVVAETTCAIAVSYEAKAIGIKTGTSVKAARKLCRDLTVVQARPSVYMQYHEGILEALNSLFVTVRPLSVDEMACRISRMHPTVEAERELGMQVKARIKERIGPWMRSSVGIGSNVFQAKVAGDCMKPDGLTIFHRDNMPEALFKLKLLNLPGIGSRMIVRLERHGITTVQQLWESSPADLKRAWGGVVGERWWYMLRGSQEADYGIYQPEVRKTVGHSHILPPQFRSREGVQQILLRLFSKCLKRLRSYKQLASTVDVFVAYRNDRDFTTYGWRKYSPRHLPANDDMSWLKVVRPLIESLPNSRFQCRPMAASIRFSDLILEQDQNLTLFDDSPARTALCGVVDALNARMESPTDLLSVFGARDTAPFRIAFGNPAGLTALPELSADRGKRRNRPAETQQILDEEPAAF